MSPYLSLVIPAYNEEKRLPQNLDAIRRFFSSRDFSYEVIIVNDGSTDGTENVVRAYQKGWEQLVLLNETVNRGKGFSVRKGMLSAAGEFIVFSDADLSTPLHECDALLSQLLKGSDVVVGSRYCAAQENGAKKVSQTVLRRLSGKMFSLLVRALISLQIRDTQCGFKGFTRKSARLLFSRQKLNGFAFDVEILYLAKRFGFSVGEVPVEWHEDPASKVSLFRDAFRMLSDVLKIYRLHAGEHFNRDAAF